MPSADDLRTALESGPLAPRRDEILRLARPTIHLDLVRVAQADLRRGESRVGGAPDLPADVAWPVWKGEPQSFIAQIDLSSLRGIAAAERLPSEGWLWVFYSARQDTWGFDPDDRGSWTVLYRDGAADLTPTPLPEELPSGGAYEPCRVSPREGVTLPPWESKHIEALGLSDGEIDRYCDLLDSFAPAVSHQLLGHPDQIQSDMTVECQLVTSGLYTGDSSGWTDARAAELEAGWADWRLLLQVASDEAARMMWGDLGYLYFWIRDSDMQATHFEKSWMILQCS